MICVLTALVLVANLATAYFYNTITYYFQGADTTYDSAEAKSAKLDAEGVVQEIVRSGIVLLKNQPDAQGETLLPLATSAESKTKVNLFGWDSVGWVIGGSGSGTAGNQGVVSLSDAMEAGNYEVNQELIQLYKKHQDGRPETGVGQADWTITELPAAQYTDAVINQAKEFSDVAMICIGRVGGEGNDLLASMSEYGETSEEHYLELSADEKAMIELVCKNFCNVVVLVNSPGTMELGWVDEYESIRSVLYVGLTGATGIMALPEILSGVANPSGRTADLYAYDQKSAPSFANAGAAGVHNYSNTMTEGFMCPSYQTFIEYQEGIYIGYRYYETCGYTDGEEWYKANVQYPFGCGLSYTQFDREMGQLKTNSDGTLSVDVTIRNVGDVAGRDVAQLYYIAPYTQGGIEKSHVVLLDFAKTATLEPAQAQTITFMFSPEDMVLLCQIYLADHHVGEQIVHEQGLVFRVICHTQAGRQRMILRGRRALRPHRLLRHPGRGGIRRVRLHQALCPDRLLPEQRPRLYECRRHPGQRRGCHAGHLRRGPQPPGGLRQPQRVHSEVHAKRL